MEIGFLYAIGAAVTWGLVYALTQKILVGISPLTLLLANSIFGAIILLPLAFYDSSALKAVFASGRSNLVIIILSVILATLANFLILSSVKTLGASAASIIEIAYPFFVVLFSYILFHSAPNVYFFIGGALIFAGSIIIIKFA